MAVLLCSTDATDVSKWRESAVTNILNECYKKNWCEAEKLTDDYKDYCKPYW